MATPGPNAATRAAPNPPNREARHFDSSAVAAQHFADVFTKAPAAPMLRLPKALVDGVAKVPLLARLYPVSVSIIF